MLRRIIKEVPKSEIYGIDISKKAVDLCKKIEPRFHGHVGNFIFTNPFVRKIVASLTLIIGSDVNVISKIQFL